MSVFPSPSIAGSMTFHWGSRTYVMGILNMTPDSFSGDGLGENVEQAVDLARSFVAEGADVIDVGGESTRPGHAPIGVDMELRRVLPVVERLAKELSIPVSIDTTKPAVAEAALASGATVVNDVSGLRGYDTLHGRLPESLREGGAGDVFGSPRSDMARLVARFGALLILMHGHRPGGPDLVRSIIEDLRTSRRVAVDAGVPPAQIVVDPGFGFGKGPAENLELLRRLAELRELGQPILVGTSRKSTIGHVLGTPPGERLEGTAATVALAISNGADMIRVHEVAFMKRAAKMSDAIVRGVW